MGQGTITTIICCPVAKTDKITTQINSVSLQTVCVHITLSEVPNVCPAQANCSSNVFSINQTVNKYGSHGTTTR